MGFLDRLTGRSKEAEPAPQEPEVSTPTTSSHPAHPAHELLRDHSPNLPAFEAPGRLYDPFEGISAALGGKRAAFQLPEAPEFVFQEDAAVHRRSWGENLQFYTGVGYLGGGTAGFAIGGMRYLKEPAEPTFNTLKLKANRLLNTAGSIGRRMACGSAVLGLYFSVTESLIFSYNESTLPDEACTMAAGFLTASLYRSPRGPRLAMVAGLVGAAAGGVLAAARRQFPAL
jgi:import inner membrane translocase subunit TIM23